MSVYYDFAIIYSEFKNPSPDSWKVAEYRGTFSKELMLSHKVHPSIDTLDVDPELEQVKNKLLRFSTVEYMGWYNKDDIQLFCNEHPRVPEEGCYPSDIDRQDRYVVDKLQWNLHKDKFDRAAIPNPESKAVALAMRTQRTYPRGWWLDFTSLDNFIEIQYSSLKQDIFRMRDWKKIENSMEYLKLSEKEKTNVRESFDDLPQEPDTIEEAFDNNYRLHLLVSALQMKGVFQLFVDYKKVYMYVYSIDSSEELTWQV